MGLVNTLKLNNLNLFMVSVCILLILSNMCHLGRPPSAPLSLAIDSSLKRLINITWSKPSVTNGAIIHYIVKYTPQSGDMTSNSINVTGTQALVNVKSNTTYNVSVQAVNEYGISQHSEVQVTTASFSGKVTKINSTILHTA